MSQPKVTAIIEAQDNTGAVISKFIEHVKAAGGQVGQIGKSATSALDDHRKAMDGFGGRARAFYGEVNKASALAAAGFGAHFLHEAAHISEEMSKLERKMIAFGGLSGQQAAEMTRLADTRFSGLTGGPVGQAELQNQLLSNGVRADQVPGLQSPISMYANETGQGLAEAATEFMGHMSMLHRVLDDAGREISIGEASPEQLKRAAERTFGGLTNYFKEMQGSFRDVMEFSKVAGPSSDALKIPEHVMFAEEAVLSQQGIRGEVAGTAIAGFNRRLVDRTAKSRAAMAEAGLNYSDYVTVDPALLKAEGVIAAFEARAGRANAAERAKISASVAQFQRDHNLDRFTTDLTTDFTTSGNKGLQNRVAASNAAGDIAKGAVTGVDEVKFLQAVHDGQVPLGLVNTMFRESANAVLKLASNIDELKRIKGIYDRNDNQGTFDRAKEEQLANFAGAKQNLEGAWAGLQREMFKPVEDAAPTVLNPLAEGIRELAGLSDSAKAGMDAMLIGGTAIGALKTGGTLAEWAINLGKVTGVVEEAGPILGTLAGLAGIEFLPAVAGLAAITAGVEAFVHRAELWHQFDLWKHGDVDAPTTAADAQALRDRVAADRAALAARQGELDRNLPPDPRLDTLRQRLEAAIMEQRGRIDEMPSVRSALAGRDAAGRETPNHDPDYMAARDHAAELRHQLATREKMAAASAYVRAIDKAIADMGREDPNAGDTALGELRGRRSDFRAALPAGATSSAEIEALDAQILARIAENQKRLDDALAEERKVRANALAALGAPNVSQADVDRADAAKDAAMEAGKAKQAEDRARAQAAVDKARADAEAVIRQSPEVRAAQAEVDARTDEVRRRARVADGGDSRVVELEREIGNMEAKLSAYDRAAWTAHPTFTRPGGGFNAATQMPEGVGFDPNASVPRSGPAFGINGPVRSPDVLAPATGGGNPEVLAALRGGLAGITVKADPVQVAGTVTGSAEVTTTMGVKVEPSPLLLATVQAASHAAMVNLSGKMGDSMEGSMGARPPAAGTHGMDI